MRGDESEEKNFLHQGKVSLSKKKEEEEGPMVRIDILLKKTLSVTLDNIT